MTTAHETWGWRVEPCRDGKNFMTVGRYSHELAIRPRGHRLPEVQQALLLHAGTYRITVPAGFVFDGSSTPKFLWSLAPPMTGKHTHASLLHDWLYTEKKLRKLPPVGGTGSLIDCTRDLADLIFLEVMRKDKVGRDLAETMWGAVRNHGQKAWDT